MNENFAIQLFEGKKVRIVWDAEQEKYYFSVTDIVQVLTDSENPRDYIKKMLRRDPELKSKWGTICPPVEMLAPDGKRRKTQAADLEGIFRIIQAIPSKKAEPVKQWRLPTARRRPIKSTIWKPCAKRLSSLAEKSSSLTFGQVLSIRQWPKARASSG